MNENENKNIDKESALNNKPKKYILDMFPYPSGDGLHVGHPKGYIATDIYSRMYKMKGYDVVHPMGWDAFGLPAEQFALKNKTHPKIQTAKNIANFKLQLDKINLDYDWDREVSTTDPKFYKWTQWIFKQLYKKGLAYESNEPINWCPSCKTGLANEDLEGNACERCGTIVEKKPLRQWNLKITEYADRLIKDLDVLKWPEGVKTAQKNWIGRSEGSEIDFKIVGDKEISFSNNDNSGLVGYGTNISMETRYSYEDTFKIFTTRADTLFGCTYCVLAPEHKLVKELLENKSNNNSLQNILQNKKEIQDYIELVKSKTDIERGAEGKEKTGVKLEGVMAINPANQKEVPIYIADYVLASYGTGAIMAVPAHDERDYEFAVKYNIEITDVVGPVFEDKTETSIWREGKAVRNRNVVMGIIKDLSTEKYCVLNWKLNGWKTFVSGMIEEGESKEEALLREIKEETGMSNVKIIKDLGFNFSKYFIPHKDFNNNTINTIYYCEVDNSSHENLSEQENKKHEVLWVEKKDLLSFFEQSEKDQDISYLKYGLNKLDNILFVDNGKLGSSEQFDGMSSEEARVKITEKVGGKLVSKYKLRDWVFARQRYWGEPFPVVYATKINEITGEKERDASVDPIMVADSELPVLLPEVESYEPTGTGESPLAIIDDFVNVYGYVNDDGEFESISGLHSDRENKTIETYNNNSSKYIELTATDESEISLEFKNELDNLSLLFKNKNVLEIGSAAGRDASYLRNNGVNIIVSDIANSFEKNLINKDFKFINLDPLCDDLGNKKYDAILSFASLLHSEMYNIKKIIRKINTALVDNGYIHLRLKNGEGFLEEESKGGYRFFTFVNQEAIEKILKNSGFEVKKITYCEDEKWINVLAKKTEHLEPKLFKRETNTMPQWAGSSWYYLRFLDSNNENFLIAPEIEKEWQGKDSNKDNDTEDKNVNNNASTVDVYVGGDHATRHLIYARFWHKFLYDIGVVTNIEPFARLEFLGFVLAEDGSKMSKSKGNVINPNSIIDEYGSDTFRLYEMFMAPFEATAVWNTNSIRGVKRFVERVEKLKDKIGAPCINENIIHQTIKKVGEDIENFKFNTCVSQFMIAINEFEEKGMSQDEYDKFMTILFPFAPTVCVKYKDHTWPEFDENKLQANTVKIALQVNGKLRDTFDMTLNASEEEIKLEIVKLDAYKKYVSEALSELGEKLEIKKIIIIKNKIVNIVI